jgi:hypothetical protein
VRWLLGLLLVACAAVFISCDPGIGLEIVNNTSSTLCWYEDQDRVGDSDHCVEIAPKSQARYAVLCLSDYEESVIFTIGVTGKQIYKRTATCGEWKDAGSKVIIDQIDGKFLVTDGLLEPTPIPTR